jgi:signal transduction histidine kinase
VILSRLLPKVAMRKWRVARRLIVLVAIPTVLGLALTGLRVTDEMRSAQAYDQVSALAVLGQHVTGLAQALEDERAETAVFITAGRPAGGLATLHKRYLVTDRSAAATRRLVLRLGGGYPAQTRASAAAVLASIAELPGLREHAAQRQARALAVINGYSAAIAGLFSVDNGVADLSGNSALAATVRSLDSLSRMKDQASQQQAILAVALSQGHFGPGALTALTIAQGQQAGDLALFRSTATPEESWALTDTLARPVAKQARAIEQRATAAGDGSLALGPHAGQQWRAGMSYTVTWMRDAEQQLAGWVTAYARSLQRGAVQSAMITGGAGLGALILILLVTLLTARSLVLPLRRLEAAALDVAGVHLPEEIRALSVAGNNGLPLMATPVDVRSSDEIGRVARAVDRLHNEALRLAGEEAQLRGDSVSAIYAGFFRRSHSLLERLLGLIDSLELREDDPERLATLFQMDHLATRLRRNSDTTHVLTAREGAHHQAEPVILVDVLRAAVSEIEQYDRIALDAQPGISVSGSAAADTAHLLAELLENATTFSPKTAQVVMSGQTVRGGGLLISIADSGTGVPEDQLRQLNRLLARSDLADVTVSPQLGLFAVAQLAARHGIEVALGPSPGGGTTAEVHLPPTLISPDAGTGGWPGLAGEAFRARASREAMAATAQPRPSSPWSPAEPKFAEGPEIATAGGALLPLGAPVPAPAPSASAPGGVLPIFEAVESDYFRTRDQDVAGPSEPQAGQPTPADQPSPAVTSAGLPQRIPRSDRIPGTAVDREEPTPAEAAQVAVGRLASFQRGSRRARALTRIDGDARQSTEDG